MLNRMYLVIKRIVDIAVSGVSIVVLSPLFIVTAIVLVCTGEHLILYRQQRVGRDHRPFNVYKFVTMLADSPKSGTITTKNDPRILPVGKILRKTKVNELPQLFNVLFGHMSIVGPRPLVESEVAMYPGGIGSTIYDGNQPGLTGIGSLFFRNEDDMIAATSKPPEAAYREDIMPIKGALELWYREHKRFQIDLKIAFLTMWAVLHADTAPVVASFQNEEGFPRDTLEKYIALRQQT